MKRIAILVAIVLVGYIIFLLAQDRVSWQKVESADLGVSMIYPVRSSDGDDPLKRTHHSSFAYDHVPGGIGDWTLGSAARKEIIDSQTCVALKGTGAYLPVDRDRPMQCGVLKTAAGLTVVYAVGVGQPNEGTYHPDSMILFLHDKKLGVISSIADFPLIEAEVNDLVTTFTQTHPSAVIWPPDDNAKKLYSDVDAAVSAAVVAPTDEVMDNMELLKKIATSAEVLAPAAGQ